MRLEQNKMNRLSRYAEVDLSQPIRRKRRSAAGKIDTLK